MIYMASRETTEAVPSVALASAVRHLERTLTQGTRQFALLIIQST